MDKGFASRFFRKNLPTLFVPLTEGLGEEGIPMIQFEQTFMNFLLQHQERHGRTYHFLILMDAILSAGKYIQHYYLTGALKGYLGSAEAKNIQGEEVMRMDQIAQEITLHYLRVSGRVIHAVSEESEGIIEMNPEGRYFVYFDPMDGSSNIPHGLPIGFLFGIAKRNLEGPEDGHLRAGKDYIAAGMFIIPTGTFTLALKNAGAWQFHIDETMNFVRPSRVILPEDPKSWELSFNAAHRNTYALGVQKWLAENESQYAFRYLGALAGDIHRLLNNGGMFLYPAIVNHPDPKKNRPEGKLRLMYEGAAVDETGTPILEIPPQRHHQRTALYVGSKPLVEDIARILKGKG